MMIVNPLPQLPQAAPTATTVDPAAAPAGPLGSLPAGPFAELVASLILSGSTVGQAETGRPADATADDGSVAEEGLLPRRDEDLSSTTAPVVVPVPALTPNPLSIPVPTLPLGDLIDGAGELAADDLEGAPTAGLTAAIQQHEPQAPVAPTDAVPPDVLDATPVSSEAPAPMMDDGAPSSTTSLPGVAAAAASMPPSPSQAAGAPVMAADVVSTGDPTETSARSAAPASTSGAPDPAPATTRVPTPAAAAVAVAQHAGTSQLHGQRPPALTAPDGATPLLAPSGNTTSTAAPQPIDVPPQPTAPTTEPVAGRATLLGSHLATPNPTAGGADGAGPIAGATSDMVDADGIIPAQRGTPAGDVGSQLDPDVARTPNDALGGDRGGQPPRPEGNQAGAGSTADLADVAVATTGRTEAASREVQATTSRTTPVSRMSEMAATTARLVDEMQQAGETQRRIVIRLDPPELGSVTIELTSIADEIAVAARTDSSDAVRALLRQRADIQTVLEALGMSLSEFDVKSEANDERRRWAAPRSSNGRLVDTETAFEAMAQGDPEGAIFL